MLLSVSATADYDLSAETFLLLMIEPRLVGDTHRVVRETLRTTPTLFARLDTDGSGNPIRRLTAPRGFSALTSVRLLKPSQTRRCPAVSRRPRRRTCL